MAWGLPPKYQLKSSFNTWTDLELRKSVLYSLNRRGYEITEEATYAIVAVKKMPLSFWSCLALERPKINLTLLLPESNVVTLKSEYDYNSRFGIAMNDLGRQSKELEALIQDIKSHKQQIN